MALADTIQRRRRTRAAAFLAKVAFVAVVYVAVLGLISAGIVNDYLQATIATICINIMLATSLNLITGFTGQFSLGHAGFMAIGAYTTALVTVYYPTGYGFICGLLAGAVLAALVGVLVGLPTLRLRGDYLAIATLGMAEIIRLVLVNFDSVTGGAAGLAGVPRLAGWTTLFLGTVITFAVIQNFINSAPGRACIAVREDEIAAASVGIATTRAKILAFSIGAFFGGIAGGMYASYFYFLQPDLFGFMKSVDILVIVVLGGLGSLSGSVIAAILLAVVSTLLQNFPELRMVIYSLVLILLMLFRPQGLLGNRELTAVVMSKWRQLRPGREARP